MNAVLARATQIFFTRQTAIIGVVMLAMIYTPSVMQAGWAVFAPSRLHLTTLGMVFAAVYFVCLVRAMMEARGWGRRD